MRIRRGRKAGNPEPNPVPSSNPGAETGPLLLPGLVAGYRLVRVLARGNRASLYLGRPDGIRHVPPHPQRSVALKVFHSTVPFDSIDREIAALSRAESPHLVRLLDLARAPDGRPCLLLDRIGGGPLTAYVDRTGTPSRGQLVTMLAPLCGAIQCLHDNGVAHGSLSPRSILIDSRGTPVVVGLGHAKLRQSDRQLSMAERPGADAAWRSAVIADHHALLTLAEAVIARAGLDSAAESISALEDSVGLGPADRFLAELESRLFSLAEPEPLMVDDLGTGADSGQEALQPVPARVTLSAAERAHPYDWDILDDDEEEAPKVRPVPRWLELLPFSDAVIAGWQRLAERKPEADAEPAQPRSRRRRPLLLAGALSLGIATVLLLVLPSGSGPDEAGAAHELPSTAPSASAAVSPGDSVTAGDAVPPGDAVTADPGVRGEAAHPDDEAAVKGDDPTVALPALARRRDSCFADRSAECLDGVDQPQSAAYLADQSLLATAATTKDAPIAGYRAIAATSPTLVERLGDSAIVSVAVSTESANDEPASFLLVKGEAGWRIRESFGP